MFPLTYIEIHSIVQSVEMKDRYVEPFSWYWVIFALLNWSNIFTRFMNMFYSMIGTRTNRKGVQFKTSVLFHLCSFRTPLHHLIVSSSLPRCHVWSFSWHWVELYLLYIYTLQAVHLINPIDCRVVYAMIGVRTKKRVRLKASVQDHLCSFVTPLHYFTASSL